jgi:hypothetical protein
MVTIRQIEARVAMAWPCKHDRVTTDDDLLRFFAAYQDRWDVGMSKPSALPFGHNAMKGGVGRSRTFLSRSR